MKNDNPTVFVSYSWDNKNHQQWVLNLTNKLRRKGVDATIDVFETQTKTVNLNLMMVSKIKNSDYIVIILTENYAQKADESQGGVGFETILTMPYLRGNLSKLILVMRHQGDYTKVFPFHYKDIYAIDMSRDEEYEEKFDELVYKIFNKPLYEMAELGPIPELKPKKLAPDADPSHSINDNGNKLIPNLNKLTDIDKHQFLETSYKKICGDLKALFEHTKRSNAGFDYVFEEITSRKTLINAYINGNKRLGIKIWYGNSMGLSEAIFFNFGNHFSDDNDSSFNEMINCEIVNNELRLKRAFNGYGSRDSDNLDAIIKDLWQQHVVSYLER